jgi:hypothetical protein
MVATGEAPQEVAHTGAWLRVGAAVGLVLSGLSSAPAAAARAARAPRAAVSPSAATAPAAAAVPDAAAAPGQDEALPDYFFGQAAIPPGSRDVAVYNRFITKASVVFLQVDTTPWPQQDLALPEVRLETQQDGLFSASTIDTSTAPAPGIPFNYVVFNALQTGPFTVGSDGYIPAGQYNTGVNRSEVQPSSEVFLTVNSTAVPIGSGGLESSLERNQVKQPLKVNNHGSGFLTVTTAGDVAPGGAGEHFNYLIVNEVGTTLTLVNGQARPVPYFGCRSLCGTKTLPAGQTKVGVSFASTSPPAMVLVTPDVTTLTNDTALPGIKVTSHGSGSFSTSTDMLTAAPSTPAGGIPFNFLVISPANKWEEYGPTGRSGNTWTVVPDPSDLMNTWYVGSSHGGAWKTTNGGQTWFQAWKDTTGADLPMISVLNLAWSPTGHLYSLDDAGVVRRSDDHGLHWYPVGNIGALTHTLFFGAFMAVDASDQPVVCSDNGLVRVAPGSTTSLLTGALVGAMCTDTSIVVGHIYAAFRTKGLFRQEPDGTWTLLRAATPSPAANASVLRFSFNGGKVVLNDTCSVWVRNEADLTLATVATTWGAPLSAPPGNGCDPGSPAGYSLTASISPSGNRVVAGGRGAFEFQINSDGSATASAQIYPNGTAQLVTATGETHQVIFLDDTHIVTAVDGGIRYSDDGGASWRESVGLSAYVDGPPVTEFYDLTVSNANQFGQVLVGGAVQDIGTVGLLDRPTGLSCGQPCAGEFGILAVVPNAIDVTSSPPSSQSLLYEGAYVSGQSEGDASKSLVLTGFTTSMANPTRDPSNPASEEGYYPPGQTNTPISVFAGTDKNTISALATESVLTRVGVGGSQGEVAVVSSADSPPVRIVYTDSGDAVTALYFAATNLLYAGFNSGKVVRILNPFTQSTVTTVPVGGSGPVIAFAGLYGSDNELYVAYEKQVFATVNGGSSYAPIIPTGGTGVGGAILNSDVAGIVRDPNRPLVYLALGRHTFFNGHIAVPYPVGDDSAPGSVWSAPAPAGSLASWTGMSEGLPPGLPITGIGLAPNKALFIATQGRGVWWRRDVVSGIAGGANTPLSGGGLVGATVAFDTRCSYPTGWRHIATLDFKLAQLRGPGDGEPFALWAEVDTKRGVFRLYDSDRHAWIEGRPGEHRILQTRLASLDLSRSRFGEVAGAAAPTVDIRWAVALQKGARGTLQQYVRVVDDKGAASSWDKVGSWQVRARSSRTVLVAALLAALAVAVVALGAVAAAQNRHRRRLVEPR